MSNGPLLVSPMKATTMFAGMRFSHGQVDSVSAATGGKVGMNFVGGCAIHASSD